MYIQQSVSQELGQTLPTDLIFMKKVYRGNRNKPMGKGQKSCLQILTCQDIIPFLWDQGQRSIFGSFFILIQCCILKQKMLTWVCSISLLTLSVACLHTWAKQAKIILMLTKMQIIMSNNVDPTVLRPVLRIVLAIDGVAHVIAAVWSSYSQLFSPGGC